MVFTRGVLPSHQWLKVRVIKKIKSGIANHNDIVDLRALSNGLQWNNTKFTTTFNEMVIGGNVKEIKTGFSYLGNDRYKISAYSTSIVYGSNNRFGLWRAISYQEQLHTERTYQNIYEKNDCIYFSLNVELFDLVFHWSLGFRYVIKQGYCEILVSYNHGDWERIFYSGLTNLITGLPNQRSGLYSKYLSVKTNVRIKVIVKTGEKYAPESTSHMAGGAISGISFECFGISDSTIDISPSKVTWFAIEG